MGGDAGHKLAAVQWMLRLEGGEQAKSTPCRRAGSAARQAVRLTGRHRRSWRYYLIGEVWPMKRESAVDLPWPGWRQWCAVPGWD